METVQIGKGSFSDVFKGSIILTGESVAIKRVSLKNLEKTGEKTTEEDLTTEINIMRSLDHPYIVKYYDVIKTTDYWYIIMEYCDGGTLANVIDYNKQNDQIDREPNTAYYMSQLKDAIYYIRSKGVMHRDIKPMNILLSKPNKMTSSDADVGLLFMIDSDKNKTPSWDKTQQLIVKVADFGLARKYREDDQNLSNTICGSPLYMAPEILVHNKYNSRIDLWAYGVILYEMLFGVYPLSAKNMPQLKLQLKQKKIDFHLDHKFTPECFDLLTKLLEKNNEIRINWDDFFSHKWFMIWDSTFYLPVKNTLSLPELSTSIKSIVVPHRKTISSQNIETVRRTCHPNSCQKAQILERQGISAESPNAAFSADILSKRDSCHYRDLKAVECQSQKKIIIYRK